LLNNEDTQVARKDPTPIVARMAHRERDETGREVEIDIQRDRDISRMITGSAASEIGTRVCFGALVVVIPAIVRFLYITSIYTQRSYTLIPVRMIEK